MIFQKLQVLEEFSFLQKIYKWYHENSGIEINNWGSSSFESRDINKPDEVNSLQWKLFKKGDDCFFPSKKGVYD